MKKNAIIVVIAMLPLLNLHCKSIKGDLEDNCYNIQIDMEGISADFNLLTLDRFVNDIGNIDFIILETHENSIISRVRKLIYFNELLVIMQGVYEPVHVFSINGKYIKSISNFGKGPKEILEVRDISVTPCKQLAILDYGRIHYYDSTLHFNRIEILNNESSGGNIPSRFYFHNDYLLLWHGSTGVSDNGLIVYNQVSKKTEDYFPVNHFIPNAEIRFSGYHDTVIIVPPVLDDIIYHFVEGLIIPRYKIIFNKQGEVKHFDPPTDRRDYISFLSYLNTNETALMVIKFFETENYIFFTFTLQQRMYDCFYDKNSRKTHVSFARSLINIFDLPPNTLRYSDNDVLYFTMDAEKLLDLISEGKTGNSYLSNKRRTDLLNKLGNLDITDNPVIGIINLNKTKENEEL